MPPRLYARDGQAFDFFFYGTLCHPTILTRVLKRQTDELEFQDAILPEYTRHHVKNEDYPAVIDKRVAQQLLSKQGDTSGVDFSTRGTLVKGLNYRDALALDTFEGKQYSRYQLPVRILNPPGPDGTQTSKELVEAWVYVWIDRIELLEPRIWDYETFVKDKADVWTGASTKEYDEVDEHHASQGAVGSSASTPGPVLELEGQRKAGYPDFGHGMLKYWAFKEGYLNFNNGSYGSPPIPVLRAMRAISDECESLPDQFMKKTYLPHLIDARKRVAKLINAELDEVVIVPGATHGMNTIMREIRWDDGDIIIAYNTTYGAVAQTLKYLADRYPGLTLEFVTIEFPVSHAEIVKRTEEILAKYNYIVNPDGDEGRTKSKGRNSSKRVRSIVIDQISSMPGMIYPMNALVQLCKKYGVLSMVDAAHAIGQVKTDVKFADPDFWVSNCHKWLYAHRACAVLYVPKRNQHLITSSLPTGAGYESERYPTAGGRPREFATQISLLFDWVGTQDWAPFFSINSAVQFREKIGGEDRIMSYCHSLAVAGGERLKARWGEGTVMDNDQGELTAAMLNVFLPSIPIPQDVKEQMEVKLWIDNRLFEANAYCSVYLHAGRLCARFSCQVWNQLEDFDRIAGMLERTLQEIRQAGQAPQVIELDAEE